MPKMSCRFWGAIAVLLVVGMFSVGLRKHAIESMSPVFEEPFHLMQGVAFQQTGHWPFFREDPPLFPWFLGVVATRLSHFAPLEQFAADKSVFESPYRYRLDKFSNLPQDAIIIRLRWACQLWVGLGLIALATLAFRLGLNLWQGIALLSFFALEPAVLGLSCVASDDVMAVALLLAATAVYTFRSPVALGVSALLFSLAWATKLTSLLWVVPIGLGWKLGKCDRRLFLCWVVGAVGGMALTRGLLNYPRFAIEPSPRSYLDGLITVNAPLVYFAQALLCKLSAVALMVLGWAFWKRVWKGRDRLAAWVAGAVVGALLLSVYLFPATGFRYVLPLVLVLLWCAAVPCRTPAVSSVLVLALVGEAALARQRLVAYQNLLAGATPRLLASNTDWGQGMKEFARWRQANGEGLVAVARYGGTGPELYGATEYVPLSSYPAPPAAKPPADLRPRYIAVSRNFLSGYIVRDRALMALADHKPITCFQGALCLYDLQQP